MSRAIRVLAAWEATRPHPTQMFELRRILRWYSREFHVPLPQVEEEVALDDVLQAYYEEYYANLADSERGEDQRALEDDLRELVMTPVERARKDRQKFEHTTGGDDFHREAQKEWEAAQRAAKAPAAAPAQPEGDISLTFKDLEDIEREALEPLDPP